MKVYFGEFQVPLLEAKGILPTLETRVVLQLMFPLVSVNLIDLFPQSLRTLALAVDKAFAALRPLNWGELLIPQR